MMDNVCICNEHIERLGPHLKPTRLCPVHGDPVLLVLVDKIEQLGQEVRALRRVLDRIKIVSQVMKPGPARR